MSKKGGAKAGGTKRDGGALYKGMAIKLSDIVVGDTLGALLQCHHACGVVRPRNGARGPGNGTARLRACRGWDGR
jgi:hypothetical protein